jgi:hypothetical protein
MRGGTRAGVALVVAALSLPPRPARAEGASGAALVVVVTSEPHGSLARRVRAELEGLGVDVLVLKPPGEGSPERAPLEQTARNVGAVAAVRLVVSGEGKIEVWVADRVTGKAVVRELDAPATGASDAAVATGSVELLRASLMELHSPEPPRGEVAPTPQIAALALPSTASSPVPPRLGLSVGAGAELGIGGFGPSADASVGLWVRVAGRFGVRFVGRATIAPSEATTPAGTVDLRSQLAGALASADLADPAAAWVPSVELGIAAAHVATSGAASPPYVGAADDAWFAAPLAGAGVAWSFARGLRLRGEGLVAWAIPTARVETPKGEAGLWGAPSIAMSLCVEVLWAP